MNVLITGAAGFNKHHIKAIEESGFHVFVQPDESSECVTNPTLTDIIICNGFFLYHDIRQFTRLKMIQLTSAGTDRVPVDYIAEKGIMLNNAVGVYSIPIAEWVITRILDIYKQSTFFFRNQMACNWQKNRTLRELTGQNVCILGFGNIGKETARRLKPFGVEIMAVESRELSEDEIELTNKVFKPYDMDIALALADIVIITLPLIKDTFHLVDTGKLARLKSTALIVNPSRGAVVDENALIDWLLKNKNAYAALDVFETEPLPAEHIFWNMENVLVSPHNSFVSDRVQQRLFELVKRNLGKWVVGSG